MAGARQPGSTCGHTHGSCGHKSHGSARPGLDDSHHKSSPIASIVAVEIDPATLKKRIALDRQVTVQQASLLLFGDSTHVANLCSLEGSKAYRFELTHLDVATVMSMRSDVRDAIIQGGVLRSNVKPWDFPAWVPNNVQDEIKSGKLARGVTRYPGEKNWGDIVVWKGGASVQIYQEFPEDLAYYEGIVQSSHTARLIHFAYTGYNHDMRYFVDEKGMSPEDARSELRRINDEVFKLVLEGAVDMLTAGAGISQVNNAMRFNSEELASAVKRSPRMIQDPPALTRLYKTQVNLQNNNVVRKAYVLSEPRTFRHTLSGGGTPPGLTYNYIKNRGNLRFSNGVRAHYGEGVYTWAAGKSVKNYIDIEVPAGVAVEELKVEGVGEWYRLVSAEGTSVPVKVIGTDIAEDEIKQYEAISKNF